MSRRLRPSPDRHTPALEALRALVRENIPAQLGPYLRNLARASVVIGGVAVAGCSSSHFPPGEELTPPTCLDGRWQVLDGISSPGTYDSVSALSQSGLSPAGVPFDQMGVACSTATDQPACEATVQALTNETFGNYLLTTQGDDVATHQTEAEVLAFLGPIDTAGDALLRVWHAGYSMSCDDIERGGVRDVEGGYEVIATQTSGGCGEPVVLARYLLFVATDGTLTVLSREELEQMEDWGCEGRRPDGLQPVNAPIPGEPLGRWFASMARLEESAVDAFLGVARELEEHGAPDSLVEASRIASRDEVRHHEAMSRLARRFGAEPLPAEIVPHPVRPLFAIALENAIEGCIRETYGALAAHRQSFAASDPDIASTMAEIAEDESRHAALSWEIAAWIEPLLREDERDELAIAKARAFSELRAEAETEPSPELVKLAGVPDAQTAQALLTHLADTVFA